MGKKTLKIAAAIILVILAGMAFIEIYIAIAGNLSVNWPLRVYADEDQYCYEGFYSVPDTDYHLYLVDTTARKAKYLYITKNLAPKRPVLDSNTICFRIDKKPHDIPHSISISPDSIFYYGYSEPIFDPLGKCRRTGQIVEYRKGIPWVPDDMVIMVINSYDNKLSLYLPDSIGDANSRTKMDSVFVMSYAEHRKETHQSVLAHEE